MDNDGGGDDLKWIFMVLGQDWGWASSAGPWWEKIALSFGVIVSLHVFCCSWGENESQLHKKLMAVIFSMFYQNADGIGDVVPAHAWPSILISFHAKRNRKFITILVLLSNIDIWRCKKIWTAITEKVYWCIFNATANWKICLERIWNYL